MGRENTNECVDKTKTFRANGGSEKQSERERLREFVEPSRYKCPNDIILCRTNTQPHTHRDTHSEAESHSAWANKCVEKFESTFLKCLEKF